MISVSLVCYKHSQKELIAVLEQFLVNSLVEKIYVINNDVQSNYKVIDPRVEIIDVRKNVGYGRGHNIAIRLSRRSGYGFHIVSNLDIELNCDTITKIFERTIERETINIFGPKIYTTEGQVAANPRCFPTFYDMCVRFIVPYRFRTNHNQKYELLDQKHGYDIEGGYLSGCFILIRNTLLEIEFDERYFMYPEDIDLSRTYGPGLMVSSSSIIHHHNAESKRSLKLAAVHIVNMMRYFMKYAFVKPDTGQLNRDIRFYE